MDAAGLAAESELFDVELLDLDLRDEQLGASSLETARVKGCRFEGAELRRLRCRQVVFETCDFANTRWFDCELSDVAFLDCRFIGASITGGGMSAVFLRDCLAQLAKLTHLGRPHALLEGCDLRGALLMESDLSELRFSGCDLEGLEFAGVTLAGSDLRGNELVAGPVRRRDNGSTPFGDGIVENTNRLVEPDLARNGGRFKPAVKGRERSRQKPAEVAKIEALRVRGQAGSQRKRHVFTHALPHGRNLTGEREQTVRRCESKAANWPPPPNEWPAAPRRDVAGAKQSA